MSTVGAVIGTAVVQFDADTEGFEKGADKVETKATGLGGHLKTIGDTAAGMFAGMMATQAIGWLGEAARAAQEDEAATARLDTTLANLATQHGKGAAEVAKWKKELDGAIDKGQKMAFTDDDIRDSFAFLATATGDTDEAFRRQTIAMDLARGANIPLSQATKMLGKMTDENIQTFKKMGITFAEGTSEADALAQVQAKYANQADSFAQSSAGQAEMSKIKMAELQETIGGLVIPVMNLLTTGMLIFTDVVGAALVPAMDGAKAAMGFFSDNAAIFLPILIGLGAGLGVLAAIFLVGIIPAIAAATIVWIAHAIAVIIAAAPYILLVIAVAAVIAAAVLLYQNWDKVTAFLKSSAQTVLDFFSGPWAAVSGALSGPFDVAKGIIETAFGVIQTVVSTGLNFIEALIAPALTIWKTLFTVGFGAIQIYIETVWGAISIIFKMAFGVIQGILDVFIGIFTGDWDRAWNGIKQIVDSVWEGIKGLIKLAIGAIGNMAGLMKQAGIDLITGLWDGMKGMFTSGASFALDIASTVANAIIGAIEGALNAVIGGVNDAIPNEITMPNEIPNIDLPDNPIPFVSLPRFGRGGIIAHPTIGVIGENGPEAVIPLSKLRDVMRTLSPAGATDGRDTGGKVVQFTANLTFNGPTNAAELKAALEEWWSKKVDEEFGHNAVLSGVKVAA